MTVIQPISQAMRDENDAVEARRRRFFAQANAGVVKSKRGDNLSLGQHYDLAKRMEDRREARRQARSAD